MQDAKKTKIFLLWMVIVAGFYGSMHFWRNTQQAEIDFLELEKGKINAYEIKYSLSRNVIFTKSFTEKYHPENTFVVNKDNFENFL